MPETFDHNPSPQASPSPFQQDMQLIRRDIAEMPDPVMVRLGDAIFRKFDAMNKALEGSRRRVHQVQKREKIQVGDALSGLESLFFGGLGAFCVCWIKMLQAITEGQERSNLPARSAGWIAKNFIYFSRNDPEAPQRLCRYVSGRHLHCRCGGSDAPQCTHCVRCCPVRTVWSAPHPAGIHVHVAIRVFFFCGKCV